MKWFRLIGIIALISLVVFLGAYRFLPLRWLDNLFVSRTFGVSLTTINGGDTLSASRTVINNNFTALNAKLENYDAFTHVLTSTSATSTLSIFGGGLITQASSTFQGLSVFTGGINASSTASTTFANGITLDAGCFRVGGACLTQGSGTVTSVGVSSSGTITVGSSPITTSGTITVNLNLGNANTWTASQFFNSSTTFSPTLFGGNVNLSGLITASSTATSTFLGGINLGVNPNGTISGGGLGVGTTTLRGRASFDGEVTLNEYRFACTGAVTIDWSNGNNQVCIMTGNVTSVTLTGGDAGTTYSWEACQDGTGDRTIRGWAANILFQFVDPTFATSTPGHTTKAGTCNFATFRRTSATGTSIYQGTLFNKTY